MDCSSCGEACVRPSQRPCCRLWVCQFCVELFPRCDCRDFGAAVFSHDKAEDVERNHQLYRHVDQKKLLIQPCITKTKHVNLTTMKPTTKKKKKTLLLPEEMRKEIPYYLDFEATDKIPMECRIVQIGCLMVDPETKEEHVFSTLVKADMSIVAAASEVTGIRDEHLVGAPGCAAALRKFFDWIDETRKGNNVIFVAHNGSGYDYLLLMSEMHRWDMPPFVTLKRHGVVRLADSLPWARVNIPSHKLVKKPTGEPSFKLGDLHESLVGKRFEGAHDALTDCRALRSICESEYVCEKGFCLSQHNGHSCNDLRMCVDEFQRRREGMDRTARAKVKAKVDSKVGKRTLLSFFKPRAESEAKRRKTD